jgi:hypothetical protein
VPTTPTSAPRSAQPAAAAAPESRRSRPPYAPPAITFHQPLELFAAVCSPGKSDPITCPAGPISS